MTLRWSSRTILAVALIASPLLLSACKTPQEAVQNEEDRLVAAGFVARPADTVKRQAMLLSLPAHRFQMRQVGGRYVYLYADPLVCGCLYVGSDTAYGRYKQMLFQQHLADQQQMTAQLYADPAWDIGGWDGPFGPGPY